MSFFKILKREMSIGFGILLSIFIFSLKCGAYSYHQQMNWGGPKITHQLKNGKVVSKIPMKDFLKSQGKKAEFEGNVFLVELDNGLKAVFKSFTEDDLGDAYAEVAAYQASIILGFPNIPPTIMREINGEKGSLQLFIDSPIDPLVPGVYDQALKEVEPEELENLKIFYFVFGQWDTGPHNIIILGNQQKKHLIAIDNSGIRNHQYVKYGDLPFVRVSYSDAFQTNDWDKPFPFGKEKTIAKATPDNLRKYFGNKLPKTFYQSFKSYGKPFRFVIYQNSLWRQFHAFDNQFIKSFAPYCSEKTKKSLKKLDLPVLKKIFADAKNADFLTPGYFKAILERRDQVLKHTNRLNF